MNTEPGKIACDDVASAGIAVVGIGVCFPEAATLAQFRENLTTGRDSVRPMSRERAAATGLDAPESYQQTGFIDDIHTFDYPYFRLSRREASLIDPQQRLALVAAHRAIEDAGYSIESLQDSATAVVLSAAASTYPAAWAEPGVLGTLGNVPMAVPARIAYVMGLRGPCYAVDSGCNASLIAVHQACRELRDGDAEYALAGGISLRTAGIRSRMAEGYSELMSAGGRCRAFDADADGTAVGEGGAVLMLTTMARARADRAPVHAVIGGSATVHSGHASATFSSPSARAQTAVIDKAWRRAGRDLADAGFLEAHGSGTPLGDAVELEGIADAVAGLGAARPRPLPIGSVKTNIGHLDHAAGVTGLVKTILGVEYGERYPSLHFRRPNGDVNLAAAGIEVATSFGTWSAPSGRRRVAGVSSFSLGGINAHCVVAQAPDSETGTRPVTSDTARLIGISARSSDAFVQSRRAVAEALRSGEYELGDVAYTLDIGRPQHPYRQAIVSRSVQDLVNELDRPLPLPGDSGTGATPRIVLLLSPDPVSVGLSGRAKPHGLRAPEQVADIMAGQIAGYEELRRCGVHADTMLSGGFCRYVARLLRSETAGTNQQERADAVAAEDRDFDRSRVVKVARQLTETGPVEFVDFSPIGRLGVALQEELTDVPDTHVTFARNVDEPILFVLAALYERGVDIDWEAVCANDMTARRTRLPGHPLLGSRCWYDLPDRPAWSEPAAAEGHVPNRAMRESAEPETAPAIEAPPDAVNWLRETLRDLLHSEADIAPDDDYFELGGNSILAMHLVDRVALAYGTRPKLVDLYENPRVADFAALLHPGVTGDTGLPPIERRDDVAVLSYGQIRMWFHHQLDPGTALYNLPMVSELHGDIDESAARGMWEDLAVRHETLRTNFVPVDGVPTLRIRESLGDFFHTVDVSTEDDPMAAARELVRRSATTPFDLEHDPLVRALLVRIGPTSHVLHVTTHHSVNDGGSPRIFERELPALYQARCTAVPADLPPLAVRYRDYAIWQRDLIESSALDHELDYWKGVLAHAPQLELPTDYPRPPRKSFAGAVHSFTVPAGLSDKLRTAAARESVSFFVILLTGVFVLMARRSGQRDVVIGTPTTGRGRPELEGLIGYFNSTVALRVNLSGSPETSELLRRVQAAVLGALEHQEIPFDRVVTALSGDRDVSRSPLFDVCHVHQELPALQSASGVSEELFDQSGPSALAFGGMSLGTAKFDLTLVTTERSGSKEMAAALEFATELFTESTAVGMADEYLEILRDLADDPHIRVDRRPCIRVPTDHPRREHGDYSRASVRVRAEPESPCEVGDSAVAAAWAVLLAWYAGSDEVTIGLGDDVTIGTSGEYTRTVSVDVADEPDFTELTDRMEKGRGSEVRDPGSNLPVRYGPVEWTTGVELWLQRGRSTSGVALELSYARELFDAGTADSIVTDVRRLLVELVSRPDRSVNEIAFEVMSHHDPEQETVS